MSTKTLELFDKPLQESHRLLRIVMAELDTDNPRLAFSALRATLHALRNLAPLSTAAQLGALLPLLLRGLYYEGWKPAESPPGALRPELFLDHIASSLRRNADLRAWEAAKAGFAALGRCARAREIKDLLNAPPFEMQQFWPRPPRAIPPGAH